MRGIIAASVAVLCLGLLSQRCEAELAPIKVVANPIGKGRVAFTHKVGEQSDVVSINFSNGEVRTLAATEAADEYPAWSPDGKQLAYYSDASGDREIYLKSSDGSPPVRLTNSPGVDEDPDFSPDGKQIVFRSEREPGSNIYIMNADGSNVQKITDSTKKNSVPRWSPKGDKLIFTTNESWPGWDLKLYDLVSKKGELRTSGIRTNCHAAWHPKGEKFLYSHGGGSTVNLWMQDADGNDTRLTEYEARDYDGVWIDEHRILFSREQTKGKEDYQIYLLDVNTKAVQRITENGGSIRDMAWTPHG